MKSKRKFIATIGVAFFVFTMGLINSGCSKKSGAKATIKPVSKYFESLTDEGVTAPDLTGIDDVPGKILTWATVGENSPVEYSWVIAKNTDDLKNALLFFDSAQSWNTEEYIFLPVNKNALEIHKGLGLTVPRSIYDEDGMNRIREIVMSGKVPEGGFVDQFEQFYGE